MTREELVSLIIQRQSYLCIGLDPDLDKIPNHLKQSDDPIFEFNKQIIDHTSDICVAYKPNLAFYESLGSKGWKSFEKTIEYIGENHFVIADAKRGDIGNTSTMYARAFYENLNCDAITVAPYMGEDSVSPFLQFSGKWVILLALTSNPGSKDFQYLESENLPLYKTVISKSKQWGNASNMMYVVGATHPDELSEIRQMLPEHFLLVPGVGAQGGSLSDVSKAALTNDAALLVNVSRSVIYAGKGADFANQARLVAQGMQQEMARHIISVSAKT